MTPKDGLPVSDERRAEVRRLRDEGLTFQAIAAVVGIAASTAEAWINDPDGHRRRRYHKMIGGVCECCEGSTTNYDGVVAKLCAECSRWTNEQLIECLRQWESETGYVPSMVDWAKAPLGYPGRATVIRRFGSWNQALDAAGLEHNRPGRRRPRELTGQGIRSPWRPT